MYDNNNVKFKCSVCYQRSDRQMGKCFKKLQNMNKIIIACGVIEAL